MIKTKHMRVDTKFSDSIENIKREARELGLDRNKLSDRHITKKIAEHALFKKATLDILEQTKFNKNIENKFKRQGLNKSGALTDMFLFVAISFVIVLLAALLIFVFGLVVEPLENLPNVEGQQINLNFTNIIGSTISPINAAMPQLHFVAAMAIFSMIILIFVSNFLVKAHPAFLIAYVMIVIISVFVSIQVSVVYNDLASSGTGLSEQLREMTMTHFIMINLPVWTTIVGFLGAVFLFIGIQRDAGLGGSPV